MLTIAAGQGNNLFRYSLRQPEAKCMEGVAGQDPGHEWDYENLCVALPLLPRTVVYNNLPAAPSDRVMR